MDWLLPAAAALFMGMLWQTAQENSPLLSFAEDDSDMKIAAPGLPGGRGFDSAEAGAAEFLRNRENGNVALARELGRELAKELLGYHLPRHPGGLLDGAVQVRLLHSFALQRAVEENSPNTILSHTTISAFYACIEERDAGVYAALNNSAAFSLYLVAEDETDPLLAIGQVFAKECGAEEDTILSQLGREVYTHCYEAAGQRVRRVSYQK